MSAVTNRISKSAENAETVVVVCVIGTGHYGVPVEKVREVLLPPEVTRLPGMPGFIEGIIRLRGQVIPIVDLRTRFGLKAEIHAECRAVVVTMSGRTIGFLVDAVLAVRRFPSRAIRPLPQDIPMEGREFLAGVAPASEDEKGLLLLLDVEKILNMEEQTALAGASLAGVARR
ncbi:MAG: chemotaxis protein CheW [Candidatus Hydrogenedentota bacterium]